MPQANGEMFFRNAAVWPNRGLRLKDRPRRRAANRQEKVTPLFGGNRRLGGRRRFRSKGRSGRVDDSLKFRGNVFWYGVAKVEQLPD